MAFSEKVKVEVKKRADFTCCWCKDRLLKVDVHHIVPQAESGSDTIDNAAPLCGSCHDLFGNNPDLRKEIRSRRDHWYERCRGRLAQADREPQAPIGNHAELTPLLTTIVKSSERHARETKEASQLLNAIKAAQLTLNRHSQLSTKRIASLMANHHPGSLAEKAATIHHEAAAHMRAYSEVLLETVPRLKSHEKTRIGTGFTLISRLELLVDLLADHSLSLPKELKLKIVQVLDDFLEIPRQLEKLIETTAVMSNSFKKIDHPILPENLSSSRRGLLLALDMYRHEMSAWMNLWDSQERTIRDIRGRFV